MRPVIEIEMSIEKITHSVILAYKLINTLQSKTFERSLTHLWESTSNDNVFAIQNKFCNEISRKLVSFKRHNTAQEIYSYLDHLCDVKGLKVRKSDKKGLVKSFSIKDFDLASMFVYKVSVPFRTVSEYQSSQFECHEKIGDLKNFLLAKDSVENGTGIPKLDTIIQKLIDTKSVDFFKGGYLTDLFVCDRYAMYQHPGEVVSIRCNKSYLSTHAVRDKSYKEMDPEHFELHQVA